MRLRYLLPILQLALSAFFVLLPVYRCLPLYNLRDSAGNEVKLTEGTPIGYCMHPAPQIARGINLPATTIVMPSLLLRWNYSTDEHDWLHDPVWKSISFTFAGIVVWYFAGGFVRSCWYIQK